MYGSFLDDSWIVSCESSEHALDAWWLAATTNTRLIGCKGENSGGAGFHLTGMYDTGGTTELIGCTTNLNNQDGFLFDATGGTAAGLYTLSGCRSGNDGQSGGTTYAGFRSDGCKSQVVVTGGAVVVGGSPSGPAYGASQTGSGYGLSLTGTVLAGATATTHDDGSSTNPLISLLPPYARSTGTGIAPGVVALTDASTITVNAALGNDFRVTLGGDRTMGAPSNPVDGQDITFLVTQPSSGGPYTLSWNSAYDFGAAGEPTLSTTASDSDLIGFKYVAAKTKWVCLGSALGF